MRRVTSLKIAAAVAALVLPMAAQAAVTYQFKVTTGWPTGSSFVLTSANPVDTDVSQFDADAEFAASALTSCTIVNPDNPASFCQAVRFYLYPGSSNLAFGIGFPDVAGTNFLNYNFDADAFFTNGVHAGATSGDSSLATLTVSGIAAPVPEPASWLLMIGGLGLAGAAMRRRAIGVRFAIA